MRISFFCVCVYITQPYGGYLLFGWGCCHVSCRCLLDETHWKKKFYMVKFEFSYANQGWMDLSWSKK